MKTTVDVRKLAPASAARSGPDRGNTFTWEVGENRHANLHPVDRTGVRAVGLHSIVGEWGVVLWNHDASRASVG